MITRTISLATSLSNQYENINSNNFVPSLQGNVSLPVVANTTATTSVSFITGENEFQSTEKLYYVVEVNSRGKTWTVKRCVEDFRLLDHQCHQCVYDRKYSQLNEIPMEENLDPQFLSSNQNNGENQKVRQLRIM